MVSPPPLSLIFAPLWQIILNWWWLILFWFLAGEIPREKEEPTKIFWYFLLWWRRERWLNTVYKPILLEIKIPKEIKKPIRAMEAVMQSIHGAIYQPPDWWEKWVDGQCQTSISFDIVSIGGETHFYLRFHSAYRQAIETAIYSQYPEVEIEEVSDYTKKVPSTIPNKEWDLFAWDYRLIRPDPYPIKTYRKFETEQEREEERIVDPVADLLEAMAKIKPGEQLWIQIRATPVGGDGAAAFVKKGQELRDKIARRKIKLPSKPFLEEAAEFLIMGKVQKTQEEKELIPVEMKLTPGEREILVAIEEKISKPIFRTGIRVVYFGRRGSWFKANFRVVFTFFNNFVTANLNSLYPWGATLTKIHKSWFLPLNLLVKRRHYVRCRRIFRSYLMRENTLFPRTAADKGIFILNTEELASIFHFPSAKVAPAPSLPRIEARKKGPPSELPFE